MTMLGTLTGVLTYQWQVFFFIMFFYFCLELFLFYQCFLTRINIIFDFLSINFDFLFQVAETLMYFLKNMLLRFEINNQVFISQSKEKRVEMKSAA